MTTAPVADDDTIVLPVALQDLVEQNAIVTIVLIFVEIVGTHDAPSACLSDGSLESGQIDFVKGTVGDDHIHLMAIFLIVVQGIVLHTGRNAFRLEPLDIRHHHARGEPGIFAHILEVTTSQGCAVDIHARAKNHGLATIKGFLAETLAIETGHLRIPCGSQTGEGREGHTRVVGLSGLYPFVPQYIGTHTVRTIIGP